MTPSVQLYALANFPLIQPGDDVFVCIKNTLQAAHLTLEKGDVVVIAQKIISKAEDRYIKFSAVEPSAKAIELAADVEKDPRLVEIILQESKEVMRTRVGVIIVEHKLGFVHANAGVDQSNIEFDDGEERALLLPEDSDRSARNLWQQLEQEYNTELAVIINDSAGRAWREGTTGMAIGVAGIESVTDLIGAEDLFGKPLRTSSVGIIDEYACAASVLMGQAGEALPVVVIRGAPYNRSTTASIKDILRPKEMDLFR